MRWESSFSLSSSTCFLIRINMCEEWRPRGKKYLFPELPSSESFSKFCNTFSIAAVACTLKFESGSTFEVCGWESADGVDGDVGRGFEDMNWKPAQAKKFEENELVERFEFFVSAPQIHCLGNSAALIMTGCQWNWGGAVPVGPAVYVYDIKNSYWEEWVMSENSGACIMDSSALPKRLFVTNRGADTKISKRSTILQIAGKYPFVFIYNNIRKLLQRLRSLLRCTLSKDLAKTMPSKAGICWQHLRVSMPVGGRI